MSRPNCETEVGKAPENGYAELVSSAYRDGGRQQGFHEMALRYGIYDETNGKRVGGCEQRIWWL